jgi:hypothetical protein
MKKLFALLFLAITLMACKEAPKDMRVVYHIIKKPIVDSTGLTPPPPPALYYGHHNFIVSTNGKTYYHYFDKIMWGCGNGIDFSKPEFINLKPSDLIALSDEDIEDFVNKTVQDTSSIGKRLFVSVSSPTDSIYNRHFEIIKNIIQQKRLRYYTIRNTTEEELAVLDARVHGKNYNSDSIKWKQGFGGITFLPPKAKD